MIPADKLTAIAEGIVEKYAECMIGSAKSHQIAYFQFTRETLAEFVETVLACGAAHAEHQRKHGR